MKTNTEIKLRPAMRYALLKILPLVLLSAALLLPAWSLSPFFLFFSFGVLGASCYRILYIRSSVYLITDEVLKVNRGIFFKRSDQLEMYRIRDYIVTRPFMLQLCGLMNVTLISTDAENPVVTMVGIPDSDLIDTIREYVQRARKDNNIFEIN